MGHPNHAMTPQDVRNSIVTNTCAASSWLMGIFAFSVAEAHAWLSLLALSLTCMVSSFGIWVAWSTVRLRRLQREHASNELCRECLDGYPPLVCPKPKCLRSPKCPHYENP